MVVPFWGSYLESYKVIPKRNYYGAYGYANQKESVLRGPQVSVLIGILKGSFKGSIGIYRV